MPSFLLGDGIELSTNDPVNLSFSDKELLDLQFTLQRLAALCAATGFPDDFYNDEDEDPEESSCCDTSGGGAEEESDEGRGRYFRSLYHRIDPLSFLKLSWKLLNVGPVEDCPVAIVLAFRA